MAGGRGGDFGKLRSKDKFSPHELSRVGGFTTGGLTLSDGFDKRPVVIGLSFGGVGCLDTGEGTGLYFLSDLLCVDNGGEGGGGVLGFGGTTSHIE